MIDIDKELERIIEEDLDKAPSIWDELWAKGFPVYYSENNQTIKHHPNNRREVVTTDGNGGEIILRRL